MSASTRTSLDNDVRMGPSFGVGYGIGGRQTDRLEDIRSASRGYSGDLETTAGSEFGRFKREADHERHRLQWVRGKMIYGAQLGVGYSFNNVTLERRRRDRRSACRTGRRSTSATRSCCGRRSRPSTSCTRKFSLRTQLSYTYTDPDVVIHTATQDIATNGGRITCS